ncbi:hypothetical protein H8B15_11475 [Hymenobacter sp. BT507]|uniref:DUF7674 domain-containing protein n=1 Tax=Hymenobacter citatus TaxID=2763506 RepID=A0ABR7MKY9_9BACT|nr:hypothetical protein [Hymenobacter citatus]MBC6611549.1 hypothetical protein [Hymenobacter citatus]
MICPTQVKDFLVSHFPELAPELNVPEIQYSLPQQLRIFAVFTQQAVEEGSLTTLKECLMVADMLRAEDEQLAYAIQNTYLRGLHFKQSTYSAQLARLLMPTQLYAVFTRN